MFWLKKIAADYGYTHNTKGRIFWGRKGSGCLFTRNHPRFGFQVLLVQRSQEVEQPGTWGTTGGALPIGETDLFSSAIRETVEEIGSVPPYKRSGQYVWKDPHGSFSYTTYILETKDMNWVPTDFNWEATDAVWVSSNQINQFDLHFGLQALIENDSRFFDEEEQEISYETKESDLPEDENIISRR